MATSINSLAFRLSKSFMYVPGLPLRKCFGLLCEKVCVYTVWDSEHTTRSEGLFWCSGARRVIASRLQKMTSFFFTLQWVLPAFAFPAAAQVIWKPSHGAWDPSFPSVSSVCTGYFNVRGFNCVWIGFVFRLWRWEVREPHSTKIHLLLWESITWTFLVRRG